MLSMPHVALTTTNPNCVVSAASTLCTIAIPLTAGSYTGSFTTYNAANVVLSQSQVPLTIAANGVNNLAVSLAGVAQSVTVVPTTDSMSFVTGSLTAGFTFAHYGTAQFVAVPLDADGAMIVGSGAPAISVAPVAPTTAVTIVQPTASAPNLFSITASAPGTVPLVVTLAPADASISCSSAHCTTPLTLNLLAPFSWTADGTRGTGNGGISRVLNGRFDNLVLAGGQPPYRATSPVCPGGGLFFLKQLAPTTFAALSASDSGTCNVTYNDSAQPAANAFTYTYANNGSPAVDLGCSYVTFGSSPAPCAPPATVPGGVSDVTYTISNASGAISASLQFPSGSATSWTITPGYTSDLYPSPSGSGVVVFSDSSGLHTVAAVITEAAGLPAGYRKAATPAH